jgi:hypothetical protein
MNSKNVFGPSLLLMMANPMHKPCGQKTAKIPGVRPG